MLGSTSGDVLRAKYDLLCHTASHADIHLSQQLRASLTPAVVLWEHGHLRKYKKKLKKDSELGSER